MFKHFSLAVNGITPNCNHYEIANFGAFIIIEVIVNEINSGGGGSMLISLPANIDKYEVVINIKYKDKVWSIRRWLDHLEYDSFINIVVNFKNLVSFTYNIKARFLKMIKSIPEILIKKK